MKLHMNESVDMTRKEAKAYATDLITEAVDTINSQLDCDGKMVAKLSKDGPMRILVNIRTASGEVTPLSDYMLKLGLSKKILRNFYVSVRESYGTVYFEAGYGTGSHTYGGGFNGTYSEYKDVESLSNFIMNEVVPKLVLDTNKAYKSYKAKYE